MFLVGSVRPYATFDASYSVPFMQAVSSFQEEGGTSVSIRMVGASHRNAVSSTRLRSSCAYHFHLIADLYVVTKPKGIYWQNPNCGSACLHVFRISFIHIHIGMFMFTLEVIFIKRKLPLKCKAACLTFVYRVFFVDCIQQDVGEIVYLVNSTNVVE